MAEIPNWHITGDWFDNCSCAVACPCTFAQAPDNGFCESVLFWHIRSGHYGDIKLDDLSFVRVGRWEGDMWAGRARGPPASLSTNAPTSVKRGYFPSFSAGVQEDSWLSSLHCSRKVGNFGVRSVRGSPMRSRPTALNGEQKSRAK